MKVISDSYLHNELAKRKTYYISGVERVIVQKNSGGRDRLATNIFTRFP